MSNWTNVIVRSRGRKIVILKNGKGKGGTKFFSCGKFAPGSLPVVGEVYEISGLEENDVFDFDFKLLCSFSGEISEFVANKSNEEE